MVDEPFGVKVFSLRSPGCKATTRVCQEGVHVVLLIHKIEIEKPPLPYVSCGCVNTD